MFSHSAKNDHERNQSLIEVCAPCVCLSVSFYCGNVAMCARFQAVLPGGQADLPEDRWQVAQLEAAAAMKQPAAGPISDSSSSTGSIHLKQGLY